MKEKLLAGVELINKKLGEEPFLIELVRTNLSVTGDISYALAELWSLPEDFKAVRIEWGEFETKINELIERNLRENAEFKESLENSNNEFKTQTTQAAEEFKTQQTQRQEAYEASLTQKQTEFEAAQTQKHENFKNEVETDLATYKTDLESANNEFKTQTTQAAEEFKTTQAAAYEAFKGEVTQKQTAHEATVTNALNTQKQEWQESQNEQNAAFDGKIANVKTEFEASQEAQNAKFKQDLNTTTNALMVQINKYEHLPEAWANQLTAINKIQAKDKEQDGKIAALETAKTEQQNINNGLATQLLNLDTKFVKKGDTEAEFNPYFKFQCGLWKFWKFGAGVPEDDIRRMIYFNQDRAGFEDKMALLIGGAALGFKEYGGQRLPATGPENSHGKDWKLLDERDLRDDSVLGKEERGVKVKELNNGFLKTIKLGNTTLDEVTLKHIIEVCNNIDGNLVPQDQ